MAVSVEVPDLGEDMAGGVVAEWYLADGAGVSPGDLVCRVECSYVAVDLEAQASGILRHSKPAGSIERTGSVLGLILALGEPMPPSVASAKPAGPPAPKEFEPEPQVAFHPEPADELEPPVVVPFPRRFAPQREHAWEPAPGDSVEFASSLFEPDGEPAETLPEPGGSIPGLPLWEPEDQIAGSAAYPAQHLERLARISAEVQATAQALTMTIEVDMRECEKMLAVCAREWRQLGLQPLLEDLVLRALAKAALEASLPAHSAGLVLLRQDSDVTSAVEQPANTALLDAVQARASGAGPAFETADWVLSSLAELGIASATPRLPDGHDMAFALGATRTGSATLTMAYDSAAVGEGPAARLLARARDILESPYAMLI